MYVGINHRISLIFWRWRNTLRSAFKDLPKKGWRAADTKRKLLTIEMEGLMMLAYFTCLFYGKWKEDIQGFSSLNLTIGSKPGSIEQFRFWSCNMTGLNETSPDCISRSKIGRYVYWQTRGRADKIWRPSKAANFTTNWLTYLSTTFHSLAVAYPENFFRGWGVGGGGVFKKFSWGQRTERMGIRGGSPLVRGSGGSCNLVQQI